MGNAYHWFYYIGIISLLTYGGFDSIEADEVQQSVTLAYEHL